MDKPARKDSKRQGIRATPSGKIEIEFKVRGRRHTEVLDLSPTERNLDLAARLRAEKKSAARLGIYFDDSEPENPSCRVVAASYIEHKQRSLKSSTVESYQDMLNIYWLPFIDKLPIRSVRYAHLRDIDHQIDWPSEKTQKNARVPLSGMFKFALHGDLIDHNPCDKFENIRLKKKVAQAYTSEDRTTLLTWLRENAPPVPYMYFRTAFGTGMRSGELIGLSWPQFSGEGFRVAETIVRGEQTTTKTHIERFVPFSPSLITELGEFRTTQINKRGITYNRGYVFLNQYGHPFSRSDKLNTWFHQACKATGVTDLLGKHSPYPWRHTYITLAIEHSLDLGEPVDLVTLADTTGHSPEVMMKVYRAVNRRKSYDSHFYKIGDI